MKDHPFLILLGAFIAGITISYYLVVQPLNEQSDIKSAEFESLKKQVEQLQSNNSSTENDKNRIIVNKLKEKLSKRENEIKNLNKEVSILNNNNSKTLTSNENHNLNKENTLNTNTIITKQNVKNVVKPAGPIQSDYVGKYVFDLYSCKNTNRNIICNFTLMMENGGKAYLHRKSHKGTSLIYYANGDSKAAYKLSIGKAGGTKDLFGVRLPPGIPIKGSIEFRDVNTNTIQLLEIGVAMSILHNPKFARFKNIHVR